MNNLCHTKWTTEMFVNLRSFTYLTHCSFTWKRCTDVRTERLCGFKLSHKAREGNVFQPQWSFQVESINLIFVDSEYNYKLRPYYFGTVVPNGVTKFIMKAMTIVM